MSMEFARINLSMTDYSPMNNWDYITDPAVISDLNRIYQQYCRYKKFSSVMPIFDSQYTDSSNDVIGYYDQNQLVAFSLIKRFDDKNAECLQFAWDYQNPGLRLGIESLKNECAIYRNRGFNYLYLGTADNYKKEIMGFEILGPI